MGVYLSSPITEKISVDEKCTKFTYGASSMQGWRMSQEDAHNCVAEFEEDTSLFAVYDGHGGAEVAQYCALHLPDYIRQTSAYREGRLDRGLQDAFLGFDETLSDPHIIRELKLLAGVDEEAGDTEAGGMPASRIERDMLLAEANMPLEEVLAQYDGHPCPKSKLLDIQAGKQHFQSPMIRPKGGTTLDRAGGDAGSGGAVTSEADSTKSSHGEEGRSARLSFDSKLANGHADNDNNLNIEKEISQSSSFPSVSIVVHDDSGNDVSECEAMCSNGQNVENKGSNRDDDQLATPTSTTDQEGQRSEVSLSPSSLSSNTPSSTTLAAAQSSSNQEAESDSSNQTAEQGPSSSCQKEESGSSCSEQKEDTGPSSSSQKSPLSGEAEEVGPASSSQTEDPGPGGSSNKDAVAGSSSGLASVLGDDLEDDSEDSSDSEEDYEEGSSSEEDLSEEGEDEEEEEGELQEIEGALSKDPMMAKHEEEPGSDSGCTAVVAVIKGRQLVVANAGDSRCVLCRDGKAIDLSFDHKPEDFPEQQRIEMAGGKVTIDGRVNGGLNLSRAIGDHFYKRNESLPAQEQMITGFPDIQSTTIGREDEFIVLACDGIWNYMNSQEVIDFVRKRLSNTDYKDNPSKICEEMFDHCLAPNTMGDGTGCDNMTCIIVLLAEEFRAAGPFVAELEPVRSAGCGVKRDASELYVGEEDAVEDRAGKKPKLAEPENDGDPIADGNIVSPDSMEVTDSADTNNHEAAAAQDSDTVSQTVPSSDITDQTAKGDNEVCEADSKSDSLLSNPDHT